MLDPLAQIGHNATQLLASLPEHSHFRAPLLSVLSRGLSSSAAASLLHASASYIRRLRQEDHSGHALLQQRYKSGVRRRKVDPARWQLLGQFLESACPPKSGSRAVTFRQFTTDDSLYHAYRSSVPRPLSFNSFILAKKWLRVRKAGRYLGQFDCSRCILYRKLHFKAVEDLTPERDSNCSFPSSTAASRSRSAFSSDFTAATCRGGSCSC